MTGPTSLSCASSSDLVPATAGRPSQTHQLSRCRSRAEHALSRGGRHGFPSCRPQEGPPGVLLQGPECARLWSSHTHPRPTVALSVHHSKDRGFCRCGLRWVSGDTRLTPFPEPSQAG